MAAAPRWPGANRSFHLAKDLHWLGRSGRGLRVHSADCTGDGYRGRRNGVTAWPPRITCAPRSIVIAPWHWPTWGLWNEAADELQKADLLQPGLVGAERLKQAELDRKRDPLNLVAQQIPNRTDGGAGARASYLSDQRLVA